jgi:hypothetical protein
MPKYYDLTPKNSSTPQVRLWTGALTALTRRQLENAATHGALDGRPQFESISLEPGELLLDGHWVGSDAETLAVDRLRDGILDDETVTQVNLQGKDSNGNDVTAPLNADYGILDESEVTQPQSAPDYLWQFRIKLAEV